jgi:hypothetical protein
MRNAESLTNSQINESLKASAGIEFGGQSRAEVYTWVEKMLVDQEYQQQRKKQRGAIRAYLSKVAGLSMPQITRLIRAHARTGKVEAKVYQRRRFAAKYTPADIALLAQVDRAHERLSGPSTQCILKREYGEFGDRKFTNPKHRHAEPSRPPVGRDRKRHKSSKKGTERPLSSRRLQTSIFQSNNDPEMRIHFQYKMILKMGWV